MFFHADQLIKNLYGVFLEVRERANTRRHSLARSLAHSLTRSLTHSLTYALTHSQTWLSVFPRECFLVLRAEDIWLGTDERRAAEIGRVLAFLGLPDDSDGGVAAAMAAMEPTGDLEIVLSSPERVKNMRAVREEAHAHTHPLTHSLTHPPTHSNARTYSLSLTHSLSLTQEVRAELTSFYSEYNQQLAELLDDDAFLWADALSGR